MTNKEKKKAKIKEVLLKIVHVLCYIGTGLLILFLVVGGCQSCNQQKQVNNNSNQVSLRQRRRIDLSSNSIYSNYDDYNFYKFKYGDNTRISVDDQNYIGDFEVDCNTLVTLSDHTYIVTHYLFRNDGTMPVYVFHDTYGQCQLNDLYVNYKAYARNSSDSTYGYFRMASISGNIIINEQVVFIYLFVKQTQLADNLYYDLGDSNLEIVCDKGFNFYEGDQLEFLYEPHIPLSFLFNKDFNYNAPLGTSKEGAYGSSNFDSSGANMRYKNYSTGYFVSNGMIFNQIQYWCIQSDGNTILAYNGSSQQVTSAPTGYWIYSFMYYRNTDTNYEILVNYHESLPTSSSRYYTNNSIWVNDAFREVLFIDELSSDLKIQINSFNNNNQNSVNGFVGSGNVTDVFTLVGSAFTAWLPVMNIAILPGITLGVLLFVPLVATLVFAIIRIIKK